MSIVYLYLVSCRKGGFCILLYKACFFRTLTLRLAPCRVGCAVCAVQLVWQVFPLYFHLSCSLSGVVSGGAGGSNFVSLRSLFLRQLSCGSHTHFEHC